MRVVLVSPAGPLNVGSAARVMKNMGLAEMVLVAPRCDRHDPEALQMAVHGRDVLAAAREVATLPEALAGCQRIAVTLGRDTHAPIPLVPLREAMPWLAGGIAVDKPATGGQAVSEQVASGQAVSGQTIREQGIRGQAAIVFGREDHGLTNEELKYAQIAIQIPTSDVYPSLNLAQAIGICCYEFWLTQHQDCAPPSANFSDILGNNRDNNLGHSLGHGLSHNWGYNLSHNVGQKPAELATFETIEAYYQDLEQLLQTVGFLYPHTAASRMAKLRHLGDRATLTAPDVAMLRGMLRQIRWAIAHLPRE